MITDFGTVSLGAVMPLTASAAAGAAAGAGQALAELQAKLAGLTAQRAALTVGPPSLQATIQGASATLTALQASVGVSGGFAPLQVAQLQALIAALNALIAGLQETLDVAASISGALATGGVTAFAFRGRAGSAATEIGGQLVGGIPGAGPDAEAGAIVLAAVAPTARAALSLAFGVSL